MVGAVIGASLGVYKNVKKKDGVALSSNLPTDVHAELIKLDDLRQKNIIIKTEFEAKKKQILASL